MNSPNFTTIVIPASKLLEMIEIPTYQRIIDNEHVSEIVIYQQLYHRTNGYYNILGHISLGKTSTEEKYAVLDGQHRIDAFRQLILISDFSVSVDIYDRNNIKDVQDVFYLLNKNKPVPFISNSTAEQIVINELLHLLKKQFGTYIGSSDKPRCPKFNILNVERKIHEIHWISKCSFISSTEIMTEINTLNQWIFTILRDNPHKVKDYHPTNKNIVVEILNEPFCGLGYFADFQWLTFITKHKRLGNDYCSLLLNYTVKPSVKKTKIPEQRRNEVWNTYFGDTRFGNCFVCEKVIAENAYHVGHIVARAENGGNELSNLRPICITCNLDMGTTNMIDYKNLFN